MTFRVVAAVAEITTCDCSLCKMRHALMLKVPEQALTLKQGKDALTLYQWNTRRAKHYFCKHCGIYVFHRNVLRPITMASMCFAWKASIRVRCRCVPRKVRR